MTLLQTKMTETLVNEVLPRWFKMLNVRLESEGTGYYVGSSMTIADIQAYWTLAWFTVGDLVGIPTTILDPYTAIKDHIDRISSIPKIAAWHEAHKKP